MAQTFYLGTYWNERTGRQEMVADSLSNSYDETVDRFYQFTNDQNITDHSYDNGTADEKMQDLADSNCDIIFIEPDQLKTLQQQIEAAFKERK